MRGRRWLVGLGVVFGAVLGCVLFLPDPATTAQRQMREVLLEAGFVSEVSEGATDLGGDWQGTYIKEGMELEEANRLVESARKACGINWMLVRCTDRAVLRKDGGYTVLPKVESLLQLHGEWGRVTMKLTWARPNAETTTCTATIFRDVDPWALALASVGL